MKFNFQSNNTGGILFLQVLVGFLLITCGLSSPIGNTDMSLAPPLMERESSTCLWGACDGNLSNQCYRPGACVMPVLTWNQDQATYNHCAVCVCFGHGFNGNINPTCVADVKCLQVQLGYVRDPCANTKSFIGIETPDIAETSESQTADNLERDQHAAMHADFEAKLNKRDESSAVEKRDNAVESEIEIMSEVVSIANLPLGSAIGHEIMAKIISRIQNTTKHVAGTINGTVSESEVQV